MHRYDTATFCFKLIGKRGCILDIGEHKVSPLLHQALAERLAVTNGRTGYDGDAAFESIFKLGYLHMLADKSQRFANLAEDLEDLVEVFVFVSCHIAGTKH